MAIKTRQQYREMSTRELSDEMQASAGRVTSTCVRVSIPIDLYHEAVARLYDYEFTRDGDFVLTLQTSDWFKAFIYWTTKSEDLSPMTTFERQEYCQKTMQLLKVIPEPGRMNFLRYLEEQFRQNSSLFSDGTFGIIVAVLEGLFGDRLPSEGEPK